MKKLPNIYHNENIHYKNNNKDYCIFKNSSTIIEEQSIKNKINKIFRELKPFYNIPVIIKTKDKLYDTVLISRTRDNVITKNKEIIPIKNIIVFKEKN